MPTAVLIDHLATQASLPVRWTESLRARELGRPRPRLGVRLLIITKRSVGPRLRALVAGAGALAPTLPTTILASVKFPVSSHTQCPRRSHLVPGVPGAKFAAAPARHGRSVSFRLLCRPLSEPFVVCCLAVPVDLDPSVPMCPSLSLLLISRGGFYPFALAIGRLKSISGSWAPLVKGKTLG